MSRIRSMSGCSNALPDYLQAFFVVAYHVGDRRGELLKLRRYMVDLPAGLIRVEARNAKAKRPRTLPVYGEMAAYIEMAIAAGDPACPWLFQREGKRLKEFRAAWARATKEAVCRACWCTTCDGRQFATSSARECQNHCNRAKPSKRRGTVSP